MGGKVLCATREHVGRLKAARLQGDIMGTETLLVARTDAKSATYIDSDIDPIDKPFILGKSTLSDELVTFGEAVELVLGKSGGSIAEWQAARETMNWEELTGLAKRLGIDPQFSVEACRTPEGFYPIQSGLPLAIARSNAFAPFGDQSWCELDSASLDDARTFAEGVRAVHPHQLLAINNSPSFPWNKSGYSNEELRNYHKSLGSFGYSWSFITLAGFHADSLATDLFAREFKTRSMEAYKTDIQDMERDHGVETLTHQKWSGAELVDSFMATAMGDGFSTAIQGEGSTEKGF
jgi:isocitrate lyase